MNYIGSKYTLLSFIDETISNLLEHNEKKDITLCDIFSGTGVVGEHFKNKGFNIISNDIQFFSFVTSKVLIENNDSYSFNELKKNGIDDPFFYLNNINGRAGFIYKNYSFGGTKNKEFQRMYFTDENAKKIDAIRMKIRYWRNHALINNNEYYYLIASLVESSDKVANTASVYEAFLKKIKTSASKALELKPLPINVHNGNNFYFATNEDSEELINHIKGDILYLDPPYNSRKYDTNYHILETIALYDAPKIKGKTGVRSELCKRSKFCIKNKAAEALENLISKAKFKYIVLSYNDEGIITLDEIQKIFSKYGEYRCYEQKYKRFKADNNRAYEKDFTIEYLHCLIKKDIID